MYRLIILMGADQQVESSKTFLPEMSNNHIEVFSPRTICRSIVDEVLPLEPGDNVDGLVEQFYKDIEERVPRMFFRMFLSHVHRNINESLDIVMAYDNILKSSIEGIRTGHLFSMSVWAIGPTPFSVDRLWERKPSDEELAEEVLKHFGRVKSHGRTLAPNAG